MVDQWKAPSAAEPAVGDDKSWKLLEKTLLAGVQEQRRARRWGIFFKVLTFCYLITVLVLFTPLLVRFMGPTAAISCGGASTLDTTLPVITRYAGKQWIFISIVHALVLDFSVPFWVTFFCGI